MRAPLFALVALLACASPQRGERLVDLTHPFDAETIYWPTEAGFEFERGFRGRAEGGYWYEANRYAGAEHGGTHVDAPVHFHEGGESVDQIPLERLIAPGVVIDVETACAVDRDYQVRARDFADWEAEHGRVPDGAIVLLRTGTGRGWPERTRVLGTEQRGEAGVRALHFPGLHPDAARWLVAERAIAAIGLDTPSIDHGPSTLFESHRVLFAAGIPAFENVARLEELPARGFRVVALPMKIAGGSGAPLRIVAILPK